MAWSRKYYSRYGVPSDLVDKGSRAIDFGVSLEGCGGQSKVPTRCAQMVSNGLVHVTNVMYRPNKGQLYQPGRLA
jgi:hypothetical protein